MLCPARAVGDIAGDAFDHTAPSHSHVSRESLLAAVWLFERAGFLLTMTLFLGVAMRVLGKMSWPRAFVLALGGSVASYVVFSRGLLIALPSGILPY